MHRWMIAVVVVALAAGCAGPNINIEGAKYIAAGTPVVGEALAPGGIIVAGTVEVGSLALPDTIPAAVLDALPKTVPVRILVNGVQK